MAFMPVPGVGRTESPAIPILMFHKVDDAPKDPESISTSQLTALLAYLWSTRFCPVNISDILDNMVDRVVPKGFKPVGITADDAHRSIAFAHAGGPHAEERNARSWVDIFCDSLKLPGHAPRATFFVSRVENDRLSRQTAGYFGDYMALPAVLDLFKTAPGLEIGYHTVRHASMGSMGVAEIRASMQEQKEDFAALGVLNRVTPVLAYPYGVPPPTQQGLDELRRMGFKGAVRAYPGAREALYDTVPVCEYDGKLLTDPFLIPRVSIGSHTYAYRQKGKLSQYNPIDPTEDFRKDVLEVLSRIYVSRGF